MPFNPGETVGPYRIIVQLGQGGMATVLKAYHPALDRYVALKVLHPAFLEDSNFTARFQREARLVAKLDHPNIVPIFDYSEHEGRPYLVMKFIEGETLKARQLRGPIPSREIMRIVEAIGEALTYAHKHGVLHRDIKPSNVLLSNDGGIYLADFGLARIAASGESTLSSDNIMGTPQYISPEQAMGKKDLDEGTDIYSFGVMIYELVVGKVPFNADTPFSIIHDHIYTPLPLPRQANPDVSPEVERVLLKALAKERSDRYPDVPSMVASFKAAWQAGGAPRGDESPTLVEKSLPPAAVPPPTVPAVTLPETAATAGRTDLPAAAAVAETAPQPKGKSRVRWMWFSAGAVLLLACLVTLAALISMRRSGGTGSGLPVGPVPTQPAPATINSPQAPPPSTATPPAASNLSTVIQAVTQSPGDPLVYVQLALAYAAAGKPDLAQEQITGIEKLAPPEPILWQASQQLADHDAWLMSARLRMDATELQRSANKPLPVDQRDQLHEAIYRAFKDANAPDYISFDRISRVDGTLAQIARVRFTFYNKNRVQAQALLNQLFKADASMPEAQLLQAEIYASDGRLIAARQSLSDVYNNPRTTAWMRLMADTIKGAIP